MQWFKRWSTLSPPFLLRFSQVRIFLHAAFQTKKTLSVGPLCPKTLPRESDKRGHSPTYDYFFFSINNNLYFSRKRTNCIYTRCITPTCDYVVVILPKDVWEIKVQVDYETRRDYNFWFCFLMPNIVWSFGFCKSWVFQFLTFNIYTSNSCLWPTVVVYGLMIIVFCSLVVWVWIH